MRIHAVTLAAWALVLTYAFSATIRAAVSA